MSSTMAAYDVQTIHFVVYLSFAQTGDDFFLLDPERTLLYDIVVCKPGLNGIKIKKPNKLDNSSVYKMNCLDCPCQYVRQTEMSFNT
jgi:hypothetical protein